MYGINHSGLLWNGYGTLNLTEASPPQSFVEPLTLAEVKQYLVIPERSPVDAAEDDTLSAFISAAREQAEIFQNRDLVRKQWDLSMDYWRPWAMELRAPLVSVDLFQYRDSGGAYTAMVEDTDYIVDTAKKPGLVTPPYGSQWPSFTPWPSSAILCRFTSGVSPSDPFWSDSGARVKIGMRLLISAWYNNRLPFEQGSRVVDEYPFAVTSCMSFGSVPRV